MAAIIRILRSADNERRRTIDPRHEEPPHGDFPWLHETMDKLDADINIAWGQFVLTAIGSAMVTLAVIALGAAIYVATTTLSFGRDSGQYGNSPLKPWFSTLHNSRGLVCCDEADAKRVEAPDWRRNQDGTYSVFLSGSWQALDPAVVLDQPNEAGYAILWKIGQDTVTCFMPGPLS